MAPEVDEVDAAIPASCVLEESIIDVSLVVLCNPKVNGQQCSSIYLLHLYIFCYFSTIHTGGRGWIGNSGDFCHVASQNS